MLCDDWTYQLTQRIKGDTVHFSKLFNLRHSMIWNGERTVSENLSIQWPFPCLCNPLRTPPLIYDVIAQEQK